MPTVREASFDLFRAHGMTTMFGTPGSTELPMLADIARVHIYNVVTPTGIAQRAAAAALDAESDISACVAEWQKRRDTVLAQLDGLGEDDLLLGAEQGDLADLGHVHAD